MQQLLSLPVMLCLALEIFLILLLTMNNRCYYYSSPHTSSFNTLHCSIKLHTFHDPGADLSSHPELRPAALHRHQVVCLHHAGLNTLHIHRTDGAQIDHLTDRQEIVKRLLSAGHLQQVSTCVFIPLPRTRFPPWREQQRRPGSDQQTENEKPW